MDDSTERRTTHARELGIRGKPDEIFFKTSKHINSLSACGPADGETRQGRRDCHRSKPEKNTTIINELAAREYRRESEKWSLLGMRRDKLSGGSRVS